MAEKMIHVLHVVGKMDVGGIENMLMTIMPYAKQRGIIFDFVVHGHGVGVHEQKINELGGQIYHVPRFRGWNIVSYVLAWRNLLKVNKNLKIIHGHMTSTASIYLLLGKIYKRVTIAHSHNTGNRGGLISKCIKRLMEYPIRYIADYFFACSKVSAVYRFGKSILNNERYHIWHNAIDTNKFCFSETMRKKYRDELNLGNHLLIGHVGRMTAPKNHIYLLDIFEEYHKNNPQSKLLLLGDGELRSEIEDKIDKMSLQNDVIVMGAVNNPEAYLSAMDVFLFPSLREGLPVSLLEAQINGLTCIASDTITREAEISNNIQFISLNKDEKYWSSAIKLVPRKLNVNKKYNPFDVLNVVENIEKFYRDIYPVK